MFEKLRVAALSRKLQKMYDTVRYYTDAYDMNNFALPFEYTKECPVVTVLDKRIAWVYKEKDWKVYIALVSPDCKTFETKVGENIFDIVDAKPCSTPSFILDKMYELILEYKGRYLAEVEHWTKGAKD